MSLAPRSCQRLRSQKQQYPSRHCQTLSQCLRNQLTYYCQTPFQCYQIQTLGYYQTPYQCYRTQTLGYYQTHCQTLESLKQCHRSLFHQTRLAVAVEVVEIAAVVAWLPVEREQAVPCVSSPQPHVDLPLETGQLLEASAS